MTVCEHCGRETVGHMVGNGHGVWVETCPNCGDVNGIDEAIAERRPDATTHDFSDTSHELDS